MLPLTAAQKDAMKGDPNSHLVGKHVTVTQGNFKNYRGRIKSMMGDGRVLVELEAQLQRPEPFKISSLHLKYTFIYVIKTFTDHIPSVDTWLLPARQRRLLTDSSYPLPLAPMTTLSSDYLPPPNMANPASEKFTPVPIPYPHMLHPAPTEVPATPLPNPEDIPASPAWNPSSRTPRPGDDGENIHTINSAY